LARSRPAFEREEAKKLSNNSGMMASGAAPSGTRTTTPERRTISAIVSATTRTGTNAGDGVRCV